MNANEHEQSRLGLVFGLGAYALWGIIPLYFRLLKHLPPMEVLAHRIAWSFLLLAGMIVALRRMSDLRRALQSRGVMLRLGASALLIGVNWFTYIYAVSVERVLEASLGYFITPLVNVFLGIVFLRERLRPVQLLGIVLAFAGVLNLAMLGNGIPWIALTLATSFSLYGLLRKTVAVDATLGLFVETVLLLPAALALLALWEFQEPATAWASGGSTLALLILGGLVTTVPLLLFAGAARRLRLATLGFLQYLSPSLQFLLAVFVFDEPFSNTRLISFSLIWVAVGLYTADTLWAYGAQRVDRRRRSEIDEGAAALLASGATREGTTLSTSGQAVPDPHS